MNTDRLYSVLYDLSACLVGKIREESLKKKFMERLLVHTGLTSALWLEYRQDGWHTGLAINFEPNPDRIIPDIPVPASCWLSDPGQLDYFGSDWQSGLLLRISDGERILLLSHNSPDLTLPWGEALAPVLGNLYNALRLCRLHMEQTSLLARQVSLRDQDLQESEHRFRALVEQAPIAIQVYRSDGSCLMVNPAWEKLWQTRFEQLRDYNVFADEQLADSGNMELLKRAFAGETVHVGPHQYNPARSGVPDAPDCRYWIRANLFPLKNKQGRVTHVVVIHEDITLWKEADERLQASESRYRNLFELIPDGVGLYRQDRWLMVNSAMVRIFAADKAEDLLARPVSERVHPDDRRTMPDGSALAADMAGEKTTRLLRLVHLDGSEFWGEAHARPFHEEGREPAVLLVVRDVTDRVLAERENKLLRAAIEQSSEPMLLLDDAGDVLLANAAAARLYGVEQEKIVGVAAAILRGGSNGDALYREIRSTVLRGETWRGEFVIGKGAEQKIIARHVSPVYDRDGRMRWQIVVDRDITSERRQQEKMAHVQRLESLGVLAGGIAHDFNNMIGIIMGNASLARSKISPMDPVSEHLDNIEQTSHRAANLCRQMLAYSGKGKFVVRPINLSELVEEMLRLLDISISKSVLLRYELAPDLPSIEADISQLQQVIMNLVINANEAIGEQNGTIILATGVVQADLDYLRSDYVEEQELEEGRYVWLEVSDTGCGMDDEQKRRLFEPFFTTKFAGRGLGMSAILGIVRGHNGTIKVYSEPGRGTTVKVLFPAVDCEPDLLQISAEPVPGQAGSGTVLVVDDEEMVRKVAAMILKEAGYDVLLAGDGVEALELVRRHGDDIVCVVLDMMMPRMGGEETFTEMRRLRPDIKVLLSSGYNEQTATNRFAGKGLAGFIQKPYTMQVLLAKVAELLNQGM
jgi:PAS domain S-box-containing protein